MKKEDKLMLEWAKGNYSWDAITPEMVVAAVKYCWRTPAYIMKAYVTMRLEEVHTQMNDNLVNSDNYTVLRAQSQDLTTLYNRLCDEMIKEWEANDAAGRAS